MITGDLMAVTWGEQCSGMNLRHMLCSHESFLQLMMECDFPVIRIDSAGNIKFMEYVIEPSDIAHGEFIFCTVDHVEKLRFRRPVRTMHL